MQNMTRRDFLESSGKSIGFGIGLGMSMSLPTISHAVAGANDRVIVALIGCGGQGEFLGEGFIENGAMISHVCDLHPQRRQKCVELYGNLQGRKPKPVKDMREVFDDDDVDAVIIATPDHWHALATIWACQAGKDVYVEKPQSHNIWEGRQMIKAARKYNRIVQIGAQNRSAPYVTAAHEYIHNGKLGDIHLVKVYNLKPNGSFHDRGQPYILGPADAVPDGLDWDLWLGPAPFRPFHQKVFDNYGWTAFWDFSVGDMNDGIHQLDLARKILGDPKLPKSVSSTGGRYHFNDDAEVPDTQVTVFDFETFVLTVELTGYPTYMRKTSGTIRRNDEFPYWTQNSTRVEVYGSKELMIIGRMGGGWVTMTSGGKVVDKMYGRYPMALHQKNFLECLKSRKSPNGEIAIVNNSTNLVHLGNIALRVGCKTLQFDPSSEHFINNELANAFLKRSYRRQYEVPEKV